MNRLTKIKDNKAVLKNQLHIERAIGVLNKYENTGFTPLQIEELTDTVYNLRERIKKLEDWQ